MPAGISIVQIYDKAERGLLILGNPGSGKTTLLLELARELLQRAENDPDQPIAIILNLSTWAKDQLPLSQWLSEQCSLVYGISKRLSATWIEQEQVQFLLDGLDEMGEAAQTACIEAINTYRQAHLVPLVICSRTYEYESQSARLILPDAVELQPLETAQVSRVLKQAGKSFAALRAGLRSNTIFSDLITTPLMLNIVMLTYRNTMAKNLPQGGSPKEQQQQIFEEYIQHMLKRYQQRRTFSIAQISSSLIWLAQHMQQRQLTEFHLESLQADWLENDQARDMYSLISEQPLGCAVGVIGGLLAGLLMGLIMWLFLRYDTGVLVRGPLIGAMFGLVFGALGWRFGREKNIQLTEKLIWSWEKSGIALLASVLAGVLIIGATLFIQVLLPGFSNSLIIKATFGGSSGMVSFELAFLLILGFLLALLAGLSGIPLDTTMRFKPSQGLYTTGGNALGLSLILLLGSGLLAGLIFGLSIGLLSGWLIGLLYGLVGGLRFGGLAYFQHYLLRFSLVRSYALPWHTVRLLEEAKACILLQRVGSGYRFIHPLLQEYFASLKTFPKASSLPTS